jgi:hypothetical protein
MPSAPASFGCCDRCANLVTAGLAGSRGRASETGLDVLRSATGIDGDAPAAAGVAAPAGLAVNGAASAAAVARRRLLKAAVIRSLSSQDTRRGARRLSAGGISAGGITTGGITTGGITTGRIGAGGIGTDPAIVGDGSAGAPAKAGARPAPGDVASPAATFADMSQLPRTVSGTVLDVSPHVLVLGSDGSEQRFTLTPDALAWRGAQLEPAALRQGDHAVVRLRPSSRHIADRIWANIGRVTGVIVERSGSTLLVDEGATRRLQVIAIQPRAVGRIQVRFPTLEPGYLVDIIGMRRGAELIGITPATSQPAYPADRLPEPALVSGHVPDSISGSATWHEPRDEPPGILGLAYPALDPETGCTEDAAGMSQHGFARMPYLSIGSVLRVRNECTGTACLVPVTGCAPMARMFNDRCVTCGTSPRGRVADLTLASFIALGGELERGCFNATITIGE